MRAFLGDVILVSEAGGVTGGDKEAVRVSWFDCELDCNSVTADGF